MDANAYTPGRHRWLQLLAESNGQAYPPDGAVSVACLRMGWTSVSARAKDAGLHFLTDDGRAMLAEWIARPPVRTYLRRCLNPAEVLAVIEANGWDLHCDPGPVWSVVLRNAATGDRLLAYGTTIAKAVDIAVTAAETQGILELPPEPVTVNVHEAAMKADGPRFATGGFVRGPMGEPGEAAASILPSGLLLRKGEEFRPLSYGQAPQAILARPLPKYSTCPDCSGVGARNSIPCRTCDAAGRVKIEP